MQKALAAMSLATVTVLAACSPKDTSRQDTAKVAQAGAPGSRASFDAATHTATVYAKDYAFEAPDSIPAGLTTFHLVNEGPNLHHVQLVRLDSGRNDGAVSADGLVSGTYLHGLLADARQRAAWIARLGGNGAGVDYHASVDAALDGLAAELERHIDVDTILALSSKASRD